MSFKYYLNNQEYTPINTGGFTFDINLVKDAGAYHYTKELGGKVVFSGAAYEFIRLHGDCQKIDFRIDETCTEGTFTALELYFTNRDCLFKPDLKQVEVTPRQDSLYQCILDNYDRKFNFLEVPNVVNTVYENTALFEYAVEIPPNPSSPTTKPFYGTYVQRFPSGSPFLGFSLYVRELKTTYCQGGEPQAPTGADWQILTDNCISSNTVTWWRKAPVFESPLLLFSDFALTTCILPCTPPTPPVTGANEDWYLMTTYTLGAGINGFWVDYNAIKGADIDINNGRPLTDVINYGLNQHCSILDLQSQFLFNEVNPVTGNNPSSTEGIQMHSISDVKDPNASEPATVEETTLKEILEGYISSKLNCFWFVDENANRLIVEHYNDLNNTATFDLTTIDGGKWTNNRNTYEWDNTDIPKAEEFPSQDSSIDFTGVNINYDNPCATGNKAYNTDKFYSEIEVIISDPDTYPQDGVVMITPDSCKPTDTRIEQGAITGDYAPNMPQGMANLHEKFWKYYRPFNIGELNFNIETFTKNRPLKKLQTIKIPLCCFFFFNPRAAFIGNNFTNGQLQQATYNPSSGFIELTIQYE